MIFSISRFVSPYTWLVAIHVASVENAGTLPNLVAGKEGQTLDIRTDKDISGLKVGDIITATVKLSGDVEWGTFLVASEIVK